MPKIRVEDRVRAGVLGILAVLLASALPAAAGLEFEADGTTVTVGGYAKLMMTYDIDGTVIAPYNGDLLSPYDIPMDGTPRADVNDMRMTARESRIFLKTKTPRDGTVYETHFEMDFFADINADGPTWSNAHGMRIRHAYGKITKGRHSLLAGQTWTNFMDFPGSMPPMDFSADPGSPFVRQAQVTYKYAPRKGLSLTLAAENPTYGMAAAGPAVLVNGGASEDAVPDLVGKLFYANGPFHVSPRVVLRRLELDGQSVMAYGLALSASVKFGGGHKIVASAMSGDGIGRYAGLGFNAGAGLNTSGEIETAKYTSLNGGVILALSKTVLFTVGAGWAEQDDEAYASGVLTDLANKTAFSWHSNVYWTLAPAVQYAVGVMVCDAENMGGAEGDMTRAQSYVKFSF